MCAICNLLDKTWPTPKELAQAYFEVSMSGIESVEHLDELNCKMDNKLESQNLTKTQKEDYLHQYEEELLNRYRIK